jgi:hypothetical protein
MHKNLTLNIPKFVLDKQDHLRYNVIKDKELISMRLHRITTIKEWLRIMRYATPLEMVGCVVGILLDLILYSLLIKFFIVFLF